MTIAFFVKLTYHGADGIVLVIQLTLLALTFVFAFGLWITCKRKFILLKIYTIVLSAFVVVQVIALVALATGSWDECAHLPMPDGFRPVDSELMAAAVCVRSMGNQILENVCTMEKETLKDAKALGPQQAKAAIAAGTCAGALPPPESHALASAQADGGLRLLAQRTRGPGSAAAQRAATRHSVSRRLPSPSVCSVCNNRSA